MKAGKSGTDADTAGIEKAIPNSEFRDRGSNSSIFLTILPILSMIASIIPGIMQKTPGVEIAKAAVLMMILTMVATFYIRLYSENIFNRRFAKTIIILSYLCSIVLVLMVPKPHLYSLWMLGGLFVAMVIDNKLGLLFHFSLSFILGITYVPQPEAIIHILIIGVIMNLLSGALRSRSTMVYAMIIILSTNVTLSFIINNFIFNSQESYNYLYSLFSLLAVMVAAFLLCVLYDRWEVKGKALQSEQCGERTGELSAEPSGKWIGDSFEELNGKPVEKWNVESGGELSVGQAKSPSFNALTSESGIHNLELGEQTSSILQAASLEIEVGEPEPIIDPSSSYDVLCSKENELMMKLKAHSETLYDHALSIAEISGRAAGQIGAGEQLAYAGGLYHEIGKINGKNYIEEGLAIAEDYAFPRELKSIIKEHNIKYDKPGSVEAAIVMLTDSVVSTIEYISKTEEHKFTPQKVIDSIFQMRMEKGTLDQSHLSLRDFKLLKEFFLKEFTKAES